LRRPAHTIKEHAEARICLHSREICSRRGCGYAPEQRRFARARRAPLPNDPFAYSSAEAGARKSAQLGLVKTDFQIERIARPRHLLRTTLERLPAAAAVCDASSRPSRSHGIEKHRPPRFARRTGTYAEAAVRLRIAW
jgi:hypothetical protein